MAATVLLPLLPAYVLYKTLPSSADVSGPFKGFQIKLTGAFAGYVSLLLILHYVVPAPSPMSCVQWTVKGYLSFVDDRSGQQQPISPPASIRSMINIRIHHPPVYTVDQSGNTLVLTVDILATQGKLPYVVLEAPGFLPATIDLSSRAKKPYGAPQYDIDFNNRDNTIEITHLQLVKKP
jgi:hypothetical protein